MEVEAGDVIRFFFSEEEGYSKEQVPYSSEMVDIITEFEGILIAHCSMGLRCFVLRLEGEYTVLGNINTPAAREALLNNGWTEESINRFQIHNN